MGKGVVLLADDDAFFRTVCSDILTGGGFSVVTASSGTEALEIIKNRDVDLVITDLVMPDLSGIEVLEGAKQHNTLTDVIVITGHSSIDTAITALKKGAFDYINKPINEDVLLHTVNSCMEKKKLLEENSEMRQSLRLFEVSWAVTNTLEREKLYQAALDAMIQVVPADAGFLVSYNVETKKLAVRGTRHLEQKEAARIVRAVKDTCGKDLKRIKKVTSIATSDLLGLDPKEGRKIPAAYGSILIVPILGGAIPVGFVFTMHRDGPEIYGVDAMKFAAFVAEHISIAFENARKYEEAQKLVFVDSLTNLYNSKYLDKILDKELKRADRLNLPVTLLFLDIDNFKNINDRNDHLVGSRVLVEVGSILLTCVREVDTVIRYGGDEFVVILVDADYDPGFVVAERIRASVENNKFLRDAGLEIRVTVSIGVATYPVHTKGKEELIRMADMAMYSAKDASRNAVFLAPMPGS
ncbi:MAG: diguanylate cyclase [Thermodesulfobacteriota bacterium]|nr:MAG: diguanylate cyclase [Thermodesulfobacteriota bacterium]